MFAGENLLQNIINQDVSIYILWNPDSLNKSCQHYE